MDRLRRSLAASAALMLASVLLAACGAGGSSADTLTWYINPDAGGQAKVAENCSTDNYKIAVQVLPQNASEQRIQLSRRLAAEDPDIDIMSIDPPYTAEFSNAGFLAPIPGDLQSKLKQQSFKGAVDAATWGGKLVVAPFWSNTQVLWYRKSFVQKAGLDMNQPVTWAQITDAAAKNDGKVAVQANKYEGYSVWINALISGAGGAIATNTQKGVNLTVDVNSPAGRDRGEDHREAGGLHRRAGRPVCLQRGHCGRYVRRSPRRVHGQLDLHLDELRQDPTRGEEGLGLRPLPGVHEGRGVPPAVRRHRCRRERVLTPQGRGDESDRVHHLARQPGRQR